MRIIVAEQQGGNYHSMFRLKSRVNAEIWLTLEFISDIGGLPTSLDTGKAENRMAWSTFQANSPQ